MTAHRLVAGARCLLVDFDGPVCRLFAVNSAERIARRMHRLTAELGLRLPARALAAGTDPHGLLGSLPSGEPAAALEALLAEEEEIAAHSAAPTPGADEFLRLVARSGRPLAVTTNNAPAAVAAYLKNHDLDGLVAGQIHGRHATDPARMKPHPDCLDRAMAALGATPRDCLMIGDSPHDAEAARRAGVPFLGFAGDAWHRDRLLAGHPGITVTGMTGLLAAAHALAPHRAAHPPE
jgi:phosphoglycolate phosphatase